MTPARCLSGILMEEVFPIKSRIVGEFSLRAKTVVLKYKYLGRYKKSIYLIKIFRIRVIAPL